jgi:hypothetical protein
MGHISNPVGLRLGYNRVWHVKGNNLVMSNVISRFIKRYFKSRRLQRLGVLFSHCIVRNSIKHLFNVTVFLYDSRFNRDINNIDLITSTGNFSERQRTLFNYFKRNFCFDFIRNGFYKPILERIIYVWQVAMRKKYPLKITLIPIDNDCLSAAAIANFALRKLIANNRLSSIFLPIMNGIAPFYFGLRIVARGRFTRNQRASLTVFHFGKIPLNTFSVPIDYCFASIPLKFGVGSLKIWIGHNPNT